jgi:hypothetical protein
VGGAEVLDVVPARRTAAAVARLAQPLAARVLDARPWCTEEEFAQLAGRAVAADDADAGVERAGAWLVGSAELERVRRRAAELARDGFPPVTTVAAACGIDVARLRAALGDALAEMAADPMEDPQAGVLLDALGAQPFAPPAPSELGAPHALVRALVRAGALVDVDGVIFTAAALDEARRRVAAAVLERGELTVSELREVLGSTRKYVLPILNRMDAEGVTRRRGDVRVPGPRATAAR